MMEHAIEITDEITDEMNSVIGDGLNAYNDEITKYSDRKPLTVVIKELKTGKVIGGMLGRSSLGLLFIELVYLPMALRNNGVGSALLEIFENEGRARGCISAVLSGIRLVFRLRSFMRNTGGAGLGKSHAIHQAPAEYF